MNCSKTNVSFLLLCLITLIVTYGTLLTVVVKIQFIYWKVAESHNTTHRVTTDCGNSTSSEIDQLVAKEVSKWTLEFDMTMFLPASIAGIIVTSWGDRVGRKIAMTIPVVGMVLSNAFLATSIYLNWPLKSLFLYNLLAGLGGYYMTLLMQGYAYISDITPSVDRGIRMAILDTCLGIGGGVAGLSSGYWIDSQGYFAPVMTCTIMVAASLFIIPLLPDSHKLRRQLAEERESNVNEDQSSTSSNPSYGTCDDVDQKNEKNPKKKGYNLLDLFRSVWNVYSSEFSHCDKCHVTGDDCNTLSKTSSDEMCPHGGGKYPGRVWRMWCYLISYDFAMFVNVGSSVFLTIFLLSQPLCFNPVLIGVQSGMKFAVGALTPFLVIIYQRVLSFSNNFIIMIGFLGWFGYALLMSFANETFLVFIATAMLTFGYSHTSYIKAQMANMVSEYEHGASFALLSSSEILTFLAATVTFLTLYSSTISIYHGFAWLFAAIVLIIPMILMTIVWIADKRRRNQLLDNERKPILS